MMKKKIVWIVVFLLVVAGIAGYKIKMGGQPTVVESEKVTRGDIAEYIEEMGNVKLQEGTVIYSTVTGKADSVTKAAGDTVKAGEVLAEIDNDLLLQIKALEAQKSSVAAQYDEKKALADEGEIRMLNAEVHSKEASYEEAKIAADNNKVLYEAGAISLDTLKSSITKLAAAEASLETARNNLAAARKGASENVRKQYEAQLSEIQARIDQLVKKANEMVIKAPTDGVVIAADVKKGGIVQAGSRLFEISGSQGLYIESDLLIEDIAEVKVGSVVQIEDEDLGIVNMTGKVRKIYPKAESIMSDLGIEQKRVKVEIELDNAPEILRPGYDITVKIITQNRKDVLLINEKAIFEYQGKDYVFVNEKGAAMLRAVEKGIESNEQVEIIKGLNEGETVVLSPDETIKEGTKIK